MKEDDYLQLCIRRYDQTLDRVERAHNRYHLALTVVVLAATGNYALMSGALGRGGVYAAGVVTFGLLGFACVVPSAIWLAVAIWPHAYELPTDMSKYSGWQQRLREYAKESNSDGDTDKMVEAKTRIAILESVMAAEAFNNKVGKERQGQYKIALGFLLAALLLLLIQALLALFGR